MALPREGAEKFCKAANAVVDNMVPAGRCDGPQAAGLGPASTPDPTKPQAYRGKAPAPASSEPAPPTPSQSSDVGPS